MDAYIEFRNVVKKFDDFVALDHVSLQIPKGAFVTLLGPSGCGKTTLMRQLAGFSEPEEGDVLVDGKRMNGLPPFKRNTPLVFQEYALFPHMTVYENISYGLKLKKAPKEEKDRKVAEMLEMFNLQGLDGRFPKQLSGGQQQRVAFARALVMGQEILLLDEPLSNLDAKLRVEVRTELRQIQQKFGITTMYVTHDQDEALSMSDIIAVMRRGRIEQIGSPWVPHMTVYENISYGLKLKKAPKEEKDRKVAEMLEMFNLQGLDGRFPKQLSGGQQQRVAFARALVMGQEILLLDEPLSNLDAKLRVEVRTELRQIQQKFGITTMYVTHDQDEALSMSDIIAVMRRGRIEQIGSPWEIYFRPATRFVADFVGTVNFLEGTAHREADGSLSVDHRGMRLRVDEDTDLQGGEPVTLVVRPEGISLMGLEETVPEGTALRGTIENYSFLGRMIRYWVRVGEEVFVIDDANVDLTGARTGDVQLRLDTRKLHVLKGGGADAAG